MKKYWKLIENNCRINEYWHYVLVISVLLTLNINIGYSQLTEQARINGNFQMDAMLYNSDSLLGAPEVSEKILSNSFLNINYYKANFSAGLRYEAYLNTLSGFNKKNDGTGIPYYFLRYKKDNLDITIGSFYEQFGNGLTLRAYENWNLGYDNNIRGVRLKYNLLKGIYLTGLIGKQRVYFDQGPGIVRGLDGEIFLNDIIKGLSDKALQINIGGSFVSKYQEDNDPLYNLPENVGISSGRINIGYKAFQLSSEFAYKINDPSLNNNFIYKNGNALIINAIYSQKGLGININARRVDNMNFRSDRSASLNDLNINYIPANSRNFAYSLPGMYPYGTQMNGEEGLQAEIMYHFSKDKYPIGKYGMDLRLNYSRIHNIDMQALNDSTAIGQNGTEGYFSDFFKLSDELFFQDINVELEKRISKKLKTILVYQNLIYNKLVIEGKGEMIYANTIVGDISYKFKPGNNLRLELQHLSTRQDKGNWMMGMLEYSISPNWFFSIADQYNYGNENSDKRFHYINASVIYVKNASRFFFSYGKQREGVYCTGGVCRYYPAVNGFSLSVTSRF